mmetsp:Transcript_13923/g.34308  ORF Transcript_13923/g.34308 Transcript_13923/m.34308 type:complete len:268 (+) Transcript_13923:798-1601(+)
MPAWTWPASSSATPPPPRTLTPSQHCARSARTRGGTWPPSWTCRAPRFEPPTSSTVTPRSVCRRLSSRLATSCHSMAPMTSVRTHSLATAWRARASGWAWTCQTWTRWSSPGSRCTCRTVPSWWTSRRWRRASTCTAWCATAAAWASARWCTSPASPCTASTAPCRTWRTSRTSRWSTRWTTWRRPRCTRAATSSRCATSWTTVARTPCASSPRLSRCRACATLRTSWRWRMASCSRVVPWAWPSLQRRWRWLRPSSPPCARWQASR